MNIIKRHLSSNTYSHNRLNAIGSVVHFISAINVLPDDPFNIDRIIQIFEDYKVSAHYLIDRDGRIYELVPPDHEAWHAGRSIMNGREGCNQFAFGVELVSTDQPRPDAPAFTDAQILSCIELHRMLMKDYGITPNWIQGHDKIRESWNRKYPDKAGARKVDPGPHFPWDHFFYELSYKENQT